MEKNITFTFYNADGTVHKHRFNRKVKSDTEWLYEAWTYTAGDYYVIEDPIPGYETRYENVGAHEGETDRCYNGGTIINYKIPKTGDDTNLALWVIFVLGGVAILGGVIIVRRRRTEK